MPPPRASAVANPGSNTESSRGAARAVGTMRLIAFDPNLARRFGCQSSVAPRAHRLTPIDLGSHAGARTDRNPIGDGSWTSSGTCSTCAIATRVCRRRSARAHHDKRSAGERRLETAASSAVSSPTIP